jgi:uncharacterized metal-binding protein YceD (DUF177 family)
MAEFVLHVPDIDEVGKDYAFELSPAWLDVQLRDATLRADPAAGPGAAQLHAQQNGTEYLVTGTLRAQLLTECGRCLGDAKVPVDVEIAVIYTRGPSPSRPPHARTRAEAPAPAETSARPAVRADRKARPAARARTDQKPRSPARERSAAEEDLAEDDGLQRETFTGNDIAVGDLLREHLVLEVPMQPLCSEACQGIPVPQHLRPPEDTFGPSTDGAVDPRLAPLQRLRDNVPPKSAHAAGVDDKPSPRPAARPNKRSTDALPLSSEDAREHKHEKE